MSIATGVHHLYPRGPALSLVPYCGGIPGRDEITGDWDTGHDRNMLLECVSFGLTDCMVGASPDALGGFKPLILGGDGG